jgi:hypothetical protein
MPSWNPSPNPWYQNNNAGNYGWGDNSFPTTPIARDYIQNQNGVAYTRATAGWGGGMDPFGRFVAGQEPRLEDAYMAAVTQNPNLRRDEFFGQFGPDYFAKLWAGLGARGQNQNNGMYNPRARWQRFG